MKIELKNVKYAAFASDETACFEATVYIDSKKAGTVRNEGTGGCNFYCPRALDDLVTRHAADTVIDDLFGEWLASRDLKRAFRTGIVFARGGELLTLANARVPGFADTWVEATAKLKADRILNILPFDKALALYRGQDI